MQTGQYNSPVLTFYGRLKFFFIIRTDSLNHCITEEVDCIEHGIQASPQQLKKFQEKNIFIGPTLEGLLCRLERAKTKNQQVETASYEWEQVCRMVQTASTLNDGKPFTHMLFSSDAGSYTTPHASLRELFLMRQMGYDPAAIFQAATSNGAQCLKQPLRGQIEKQKRADFILWSANPLHLVPPIADLMKFPEQVKTVLDFVKTLRAASLNHKKTF